MKVKKPISIQPRSAAADVALAIANERARIADIVMSAEAKDRMGAALKLALETDMPAVSAKDLLRSMPASENPYVRLLDRIGPSGLQAGFDVSQGDPKQARLAQLSEAAKAVNISHGYTKAQ